MILKDKFQVGLVVWFGFGVFWGGGIIGFSPQKSILLSFPFSVIRFGGSVTDECVNNCEMQVIMEIRLAASCILIACQSYVLSKL